MRGTKAKAIRKQANALHGGKAVEIMKSRAVYPVQHRDKYGKQLGSPASNPYKNMLKQLKRQFV